MNCQKTSLKTKGSPCRLGSRSRWSGGYMPTARQISRLRLLRVSKSATKELSSRIGFALQISSLKHERELQDLERHPPASQIVTTATHLQFRGFVMISVDLIVNQGAPRTRQLMPMRRGTFYAANTVCTNTICTACTMHRRDSALLRRCPFTPFGDGMQYHESLYRYTNTHTLRTVSLGMQEVR